MTNQELKEAMLSRRPVIHRTRGVTIKGTDIEYAYISAIIYRNDGSGNIRVSAELTDRNKRSVTIADPSTVRFK